MSEQLKQLLATLHEDDSDALFTSSDMSTPARSPLLGTGGFSVAAQEFVPGKLFTAPMGDAANPTTLKADAPEFVPTWGKQSSATSVTPLAVGGGVLPNPSYLPTMAANVKIVDKKVWYYRDPNGVVRGVYSTTEMRAWADKGYFTGALEIALSERGPYLPLSAVYPAPERPFWKTIEPREFAARMRQHVISGTQQ